jgi:hypothetical protein
MECLGGANNIRRAARLPVPDLKGTMRKILMPCARSATRRIFQQSARQRFKNYAWMLRLFRVFEQSIREHGNYVWATANYLPCGEVRFGWPRRQETSHDQSIGQSVL